MFAPHIDSITRFCDNTNHNRYSPTKHNILCGRKPTRDVILEHSDFIRMKTQNIPHADVKSSKPQFQYRRRYLTRYVLIIDDTPYMLVRDSWSFLRSAIRKWVIYDLLPNTEVGIVLTSAGHLSKRFLEIKSLMNSSNRDLIASFVPYGPSDDTHQHVSCLYCALEQALNMLEQRSHSYGNAPHVILAIAPGMESQVIQLRNSDAHIVTINYPNIRRGGYPLDTLAKTSGGTAYSIFEIKFNGERSYLQTYFELSTILTQIGRRYYEGPKRLLPVEIHRHQIQDDETRNAPLRARHIYRGNFYMEAKLGQPSGFYVYTYATESPLIHTMRLTSPTGQTFDTHSDQRMSVRQLSLSVNLNETGRWSYEIERFHGNPQPHIVQVLATPLSSSGRYINIDAWTTRYGRGAKTIIVVYCKVDNGGFPIMDADVRVSVTKRTEQNNCFVKEQSCHVEYQLYDTGTGSPDIMRSDGIYTRIFRVHTPAVYTFEVKAKSKQGLTYTSAENTKSEKISHATCCGSEMGALLQQEHKKIIAAGEKGETIPQRNYTNLTIPFERYAVPITYYIDVNEFQTHESSTTTPTNNLSSSFYVGAPPTSTDRGIVYGYISDLSLKNLPDGKLLLYWTPPDFGIGEEVKSYELKYGFHLKEIIDFYDSASMMWHHGTPTPQISAGKDQQPAQQQYILDPTLEPSLSNQSVYFGLRAFSSLTKSAKPGPVSNIVGTFIEISRKAETTTPKTALGETTPDSAFGYINLNSINNTPHNNNTTRDAGDATLTAVKSGSGSSSLVGLLLPLVVALTSFIIAVVVLYVLCSCRRSRRKKSRTSSSSSEPVKLSTSTANITIPLATADALTLTNDCKSTTYLKQNIYDDTAGTPDHHTVGIPIYQQSNDNGIVGHKKHLSTTYDTSMLENSNNLQDFAIDKIDCNKRFFSGLSIISMEADSIRRNQQHQPLKTANFDSWSQSKLFMHDCSQQHSPFVEAIIKEVNLGLYTPYNAEKHSSLQDVPPVVPPLPSTSIPEFYREPLLEVSHPSSNRDIPAYSMARSDNSGSFFNSPENNNKRLRNVTMV